MQIAIRMRTVSRFLVFIACAVVALIFLTMLNNAYLFVSDLTIIGASLVVGILLALLFVKAFRI